MGRTNRHGNETQGPVIVVCPTPRGGHIEHAFDLAVAGFRKSGSRSILITRRGAREYLPRQASDFVDIREVLPALPKKRGRASSAWYFVNLVREHFVILRAVHATRPTALFVEEPRYPCPAVLVVGTEARLVLVLHNVVEHDGLRRSNRIVDWIRLQSIQKFPTVLVHGASQQQLLRKNLGRQSAWSDLPIDSYAEWLWESEAASGTRIRSADPAFVCLGEIRANKGIEVAIGAARRTGLPLSIRGRGVDADYLAALRGSAEGSAAVTISEEFLSPLDFSREIEEALAVVIPYSTFDAQSGPLAKAMARNKRILSSRLPALVDQAKGYEHISFFAVGDEAALAKLMQGVAQDGAANARLSRGGQDPAGLDQDPWDATIEAALADV